MIRSRPRPERRIHGEAEGTDPAAGDNGSAAAARAARLAIDNAKTKFNEEEQEKIYAEAIRRYREKAAETE